MACLSQLFDKVISVHLEKTEITGLLVDYDSQGVLLFALTNREFYYIPFSSIQFMHRDSYWERVSGDKLRERVRREKACKDDWKPVGGV